MGKGKRSTETATAGSKLPAPNPDANTVDPKTDKLRREAEGQEFDAQGRPVYEVDLETGELAGDEEGNAIFIDYEEKGGGNQDVGETDHPDDLSEELVSEAELKRRNTPEGERANKFILIDGNYEEHPDAHLRPRRILLRGANIEHVGEDIDGVWIYRAMP